MTDSEQSTTSDRDVGPVRGDIGPVDRAGDRTDKRAPGPDRLPAGGRLALGILIATTSVIAVLVFSFSFGNVWQLDLALGIERHIAPLIGPAVDLSVIGLLVTVQWLALAGVGPVRLRPARRLLTSCGVVTMALNSAWPLAEGITTGDLHAFGRAAVEAVAPWLLIAWSHVAPMMLLEFTEIRAAARRQAVWAADRAGWSVDRFPGAARSVMESDQTVVGPVVMDQSDGDGPVPGLAGPDSDGLDLELARIIGGELGLGPVGTVDGPTAAVRSATYGPDLGAARSASAGPDLEPVRSNDPVGRRWVPLAIRIAVLNDRYPDRIPTYSEVQKDLGWHSRGGTGKAIQGLRKRRERAGGVSGPDRAEGGPLPGVVGVV